ncbi:MAG: hypothetical protein DRI57_01380 [Deltaproteobacteria bacterium]|nr:MAG: hypothetical protein DRI57_01380 [Deltaproteobacteria bacterium]
MVFIIQRTFLIVLLLYLYENDWNTSAHKRASYFKKKSSLPSSAEVHLAYMENICQEYFW